MKTITIKTLKKELLVIELPTAETKISIGLHCIGIKPPPIGKDASDINGYYHIYTEMFHGFKLLGSRDEIKEEDVINLVENWEPLDSKILVYNNYKEGGIEFKTALESFLSVIEKEIYWVNPWGDRMPIFVEASPSAFKFVEKEKERWKEAQEKTFDKNRSIIFVKK